MRPIGDNLEKKTAQNRETILRNRAKINSLPLQDIKRIGIDSKIPNIVNIEASPKLSQISDNEDVGEVSQERLPIIQKVPRKFNTDTPAQAENNLFGLTNT